MTDRVVTGSFTAAGSSEPLTVAGWGFIEISGTFSGTVRLESRRGLSGTWVPVSIQGNGAPTDMTAPVRVTFFEPEDNVFHRLTATTLASGTAAYVLGASP